MSSSRSKGSSHQEDSEMTSMELRSKLFHSFRNKGMLQSVKSQLRNRLALELQAKLHSDGQPKETNQSNHTLVQQISNHLVLNHLHYSKYDYSLSVFLSESSTNSEKKWSVYDLLQMLNVHPESLLYQRLIQSCDDQISQESFLYSFLRQLSTGLSHSNTDCSTQTEEVVSTLEYKLREVEMALQKKSHLRESGSLEAKLLEHQKRYELQKKKEFKIEMDRFKSTQLSMMRLEEREKHDKQLNKMKEHYEATYKKQLVNLENKEKDWERSRHEQRQNAEKEAYDKRQKVLSDLQRLKDRENQLEKNNELALKSLNMEEENLRSRREQLKYKEESMKDLERRYEERLQNEIIKMKYDLQMVERNQHEKLQKQELKFKEDKVNFEAQKDLHLGWKKEAEKFRSLVEEKQYELLASKETIGSMSNKIAILTERCQKLTNYEEVCNLNKLLERDMALLQRNFDNVNMEKAQKEKEHQKRMKDLMKKISRTEELEKVKDHNADGFFREKYYSMQDKYQVEVAKNEDLKKLNEELLLSQRETLREVDELRVALSLARQEKDKLQRLQAQQKVSKARQNTNPSSRNHQKTPIKRPSWTEDDIIHYHSNNKENRFPQQPEEQKSESEEDVLEKLEREAKCLEQSYNDFKERQKQEAKSTSRVHFDPFVQRRSTSTFNSTDITRTLEIRDESSIKPSNKITTTHNSGNGTLLPLSSTQTPGGQSAVEGGGGAPSFGLSLVPQQSQPRHDRSRVTRTVNETTDQRPVTIATCQSLTQHPLTDTTNIHTQHIYDTRTNLTQYPLGDTEINTIFEQSEPEQDEQTDVSAESSKHTDQSKVIASTTVPNKTTSVEREYGLKETSIETFDSPDKRVHPQEEDVFFTPAKGLVLGLQETPERDEVKSDISSSKDDGGSMKEKDLLRTESVTEDSSVKSLSINDDHGEHEEEKKEENNVMDHYLQMVMQQKNKSTTNDLSATHDEKKQEEKGNDGYEDDFDIPLSNDEDEVRLDDASTSEYEW
ncbi:centriole and centriolar satellite protein ofd1-like [Clytia hemisphaerica]